MRPDLGGVMGLVMIRDSYSHIGLEACSGLWQVALHEWSYSGVG